jgi:hypothetical protein
MALTKIPASLLDTASGINGLIYPSSDGTAGQFLKTDGSGNLTFATITTYTDSDVETYLDGGTSTPTFATATVSGTLTVTGDLDITGDINSYNVTDLDVTDKTITLGAGQTEANSGGSGIIIDGSNASILWDEANDEWDLNKSIHISGSSALSTEFKIGNLTWNQNTSSTSGLLHQYRGSDGYSELQINNTASSGAVTLNIRNDSASVATIANDGGAYFAGNVGIGTTSPAKNLEIFGSGSENGILVKNDTNTNYRGYYIGSVESDNTAYGKLHMDVNSGELNITSGFTDWGGFITLDTNGIQRMFINTNGEISMGWAGGGGPGGGLLQVNGGGLFTNGGAGYVQGSILLRSSDSDSTPGYRGQGIFTWNVGSQASWFIGTPYTDGDLFTINRKSSESSFTQESSYIGHANTNNFFTIKNNGCVGLGSVNPTESLYVGNINAGGADVSLALQNTISNRISSLKIYDDSGNNKVNLNYDNGSNRGTLNMGDADGEIIYVYGASSIKSGFGIDLSGSSRELSIFHTSSGTDGNIALGKRLESDGTFHETIQITPSGTAGTANLMLYNVNSNAFNHVQENKVPNLTAGEDVFLGLGKSTDTKNMGYLGYEWNASGSDSNYIHLSHWGNDGLLRVYRNGNYSFAGSNVSDRDLKENIISVTDTALDKITQLEVRKFNFIKDYEVSSDGGEVETPRTQVGFIAQEVEAIIPDITVGTDGQKDMGVDTVGLVGYLTKAIQELKTELDAAKARITELEG